MKTFLVAATLSSVALFTAAGLANSPNGHPKGPAVVVHLQSGRTFSGFVDPTTDEREFVLRADIGPGVLLRPIQWDHLIQAQIVGHTISGPALQRLVTEIRAHRPPVPVSPRSVSFSSRAF
jgi:hypothetical protein